MLFRIPFKGCEVWIGRSLCGFRFLPKYIKSGNTLEVTWIGVAIVYSRVK